MAGLQVFILTSLLSLLTIISPVLPSSICNDSIEAVFTRIEDRTVFHFDKYKHVFLVGDQMFELEIKKNDDNSYYKFNIISTSLPINLEWKDFNQTSVAGLSFLDLKDAANIGCLGLNDSFFLCNIYKELHHIRQENVSINWPNEHRNASKIIVPKFIPDFDFSKLYLLTQKWLNATYIEKKVWEYEIRGIEETLNVSNIFNKTFSSTNFTPLSNMLNNLHVPEANRIVGILIGETEPKEIYVFVVFENEFNASFMCQFGPKNLCQNSTKVVHDIRQLAGCYGKTETTTEAGTTTENATLKTQTEQETPFNVTVPFEPEMNFFDMLLLAVSVLVFIFVLLIAFICHQRRHAAKYSPLSQTDSESDSESDSKKGSSGSDIGSSDDSSKSSVIKSESQSGIESGSSLGQRSDSETPKRAIETKTMQKKMIEPKKPKMIAKKMTPKMMPKKMVEKKIMLKKPTKKISSCLFDPEENSNIGQKKSSDSDLGGSFKTVWERRN